MRGRGASRRSSVVIIGAALYALFLLVAPFEHHDLLCHIRHPEHCTSCSASALGSDPPDSASLVTWHLTDAGSVLATPLTADSVLLSVRSTGRSPPAFA
jgi:hypothetical protein